MRRSFFFYFIKNLIPESVHKKACLLFKFSHADIEQQRHTNKVGNHRGAAITKKRKRNTDNRKKTKGHKDVDYNLPEKVKGYAQRQERAARIFTGIGDSEPTVNDYKYYKK